MSSLFEFLAIASEAAVDWMACAAVADVDPCARGVDGSEAWMLRVVVHGTVSCGDPMLLGRRRGLVAAATAANRRMGVDAGGVGR